MQFVEICPIFVGSYFWMLWFERNFSLSGNSVYSFCEKSAQFLSASKFFIVLIFFLCTNALKYYRFKMMDRYQLEQKSSRDMWQLGLSILENGPNICRFEYFWILWFDEFFLLQKSVEILSFQDDWSISIRAEIKPWHVAIRSRHLQKLIALNEIMPWRMTNIFGSTVIYCMNHRICVVFISYHLMNKIWFNWI